MQSSHTPTAHPTVTALKASKANSFHSPLRNAGRRGPLEYANKSKEHTGRAKRFPERPPLMAFFTALELWGSLRVCEPRNRPLLTAVSPFIRKGRLGNALRWLATASFFIHQPRSIFIFVLRATDM